MKNYSKSIKAVLLGGLTVAGATQAAEAAIHDQLKLSGFLDMSYVNTDVDDAAGAASTDTEMAQVDQLELNFDFDFKNGLKLRADIEGRNWGNSTNDMVNTAASPTTFVNQNAGINGGKVNLEQAFFNYSFTKEFSVTAGRFLSYSGWETEEPTGLFQYSGAIGGQFYGGYQNGVSLSYSTDKFGAALSLVDEIWAGGNGDADDLGYEIKLEVMPTSEITAKVIHMSEKIKPGGAAADYTQKITNVWVSWANFGWTLAAEYNFGSDVAAQSQDRDGYLLMANYSFNERFGVTARYHAWEQEAAGTKNQDWDGFTISPSFIVNQNLLMVFEYRSEDANGIAGNLDWDQYAVEALITF